MKRLFIAILLIVSPLAMAEKITATSWLVADGEGRILNSMNADQRRSIASITKLMTAMVILDTEPDLNERITGISRKDLLYLMLVRSDNLAAELLCELYPLGRSGCINSMNNKAKELGLTETKFSDPSGLGIMNISTAEELVKIVMAASKYPIIVEAAKISNGIARKKKFTITYHNTNPLVATKDFIISKTGYIRAAGGCIVMMLDTKIGRRIVVLLNSKNTHTRIPEANFLAMNF